MVIRGFGGCRATATRGGDREASIELQLCETLTATETCFPTTALRLVYRQVGSG